MYPQRTVRITGGGFQISFHIDKQIDNGFFIRPIMTRTQTLVHRRGAQNKVTDGLYQSLVLSVAQAVCL